MKITSAQNSKVKYTCKLRNRRGRDRENCSILEGYRELSRGLEYGMEIIFCFYCPPMFLGDNELALIDKIKKNGAEVFEVSEPVLNKMAYRDRPEGLIAVCRMKQHNLSDIPVVRNGLYLIAESIEKPGNLGSILRSADAAGVDGLIVCEKRTDIYNPNVIRASTGALFTVPLAECSADEAFNWLIDNEIKSLAATPHTDIVYTDVDMTDSTAILVGAEQYGLSEMWMKNADINVLIPMLGKADSLNVATAATIILYEVARQRNWKMGT